MPLDSEGYLVSQGWAGRGTALRQGSLVRPLAIPQKKTLAGLGKDRDEAFPFWDHLFSAAAKSIQLKCVDTDDEGSGSDDPSSSSAPDFKRTSTGIISNRRPVTGTPADSGCSTPNAGEHAHAPRMSLMAAAKRDAAKRGLYSRFFRGPILGPESVAEEEKRLERIVDKAMRADVGEGGRVRVKEHVEIEVGGGRVVVDVEVEKEVGKKRKRKERDEDGEGGDEGKEERKRKRVERRREKEERRERRRSKVEEEVTEKKSKSKDVQEDEEEEVTEKKKKKSKSKKHDDDTLSREEKKTRKREKRRRDEEETTQEKSSKSKSKKTKHQESSTLVSATDDNRKSKKKKRKHEEICSDNN